MKRRLYTHKDMSLKRLITEIELQISKLTELVERPLQTPPKENSIQNDAKTKPTD